MATEFEEGFEHPVTPKRDWPPTWERVKGWECPFNVPECPSQAWHDAHIHFRRFANLTAHV